MWHGASRVVSVKVSCQHFAPRITDRLLLLPVPIMGVMASLKHCTCTAEL